MRIISVCTDARLEFFGPIHNSVAGSPEENRALDRVAQMLRAENTPAQVLTYPVFSMREVEDRTREAALATDEPNAAR